MTKLTTRCKYTCIGNSGYKSTVRSYTQKGVEYSTHVEIVEFRCELYWECIISKHHQIIHYSVKT